MWHRNEITCADVVAWTTEQRAADLEDRPSEALIEHISSCSRCRGSLLLLVAGFIGVDSTIADLPCKDVEADMAAFIDDEHTYGLAQAIRTFPSLWWHTLVCRNCDELYRLVCELVEETDLVLESAEPVAIRPVRPLPVSLASLKLPLALLNQVLGLNNRLGRALAANQADMVVAEQEHEAGLLQLLVRRSRDGAVALVAQTQPPCTGTALLAIADVQLRSALDERGCAVFSTLNDGYFDAPAHSEVTLTIAQA